MLSIALVDMAEGNLLEGEPLPYPDPTCSDPDADLEEPIYLLLSAASRVTFLPQSQVRRNAAICYSSCGSMDAVSYWVFLHRYDLARGDVNPLCFFCPKSCSPFL
jgi:hypothetical protein